ncbi:hypothetical protein D3877_29050 [Azospirillum cavernae]|uniref:Serine protease n=1 Tax=Azospirillum cavernae TaxID=2320860 RepID=A0A418VJV0_9PROT|nr:trypsin-like peptidase domain-containing protein [Azospirillum cavernae]RJF76435.1 hypothetical protein D3877_29050 [Azospirillum cavernae]
MAWSLCRTAAAGSLAIAMGICGYGPADAESRISIVGESGAKRIIVDGQPLFEDKSSMNMEVVREWKEGPAAGLALVAHYSGGNACPATYSVVDLNGPVARMSGEFGTCSDLMDEYIGNDTIVFAFPGNTKAWTYSKGGLAEVPRVPDAEHTATGVAAYQAGDYSRALAHLWSVRQGRDPQAFYTLGLMAHLGRGVPQDYAKARQFYLEASDRDLPVAFFRIGVLHANGRGVSKDLAEANRWYRKAAERGDGLGQYNLGLNILTGAGSKKNDAEALYWITLARERLLDPKDRAAAERNIAIIEGRLTPEQARSVKTSAAAWKPMAVDPFADAASLRAWVGSHPWTRLKGMALLDVPGLRSRLVTALGSEQVSGLANLDLAGNVQENAGWLIAGGCMPHSCDSDQYVYGVNLSTFEVLACVSKWSPATSGKTVIYGNSSGVRAERSISLRAEGCPKANGAVPAIRAALTPAAPIIPPIVAAAPPTASPPLGSGAATIPPVRPESRKQSASGSGFVVTMAGHILTNHHVVEGCRSLSIRRGQSSTPARLVAADRKNDLAVMKADIQDLAVLPFRDGRSIRPGDSVVAVGYPYAGLLSTTAQVTTGTVTSLAGIADDTRYLQISAPVQPGNSGGPLLDAGGTVTGVIVSTLNALTVAMTTGSVPQNVNFAIKPSVARAFLDANGIDYTSSVPEAKMEPADIGERGAKSTVMIECFD